MKEKNYLKNEHPQEKEDPTGFQRMQKKVVFFFDEKALAFKDCTDKKEGTLIENELVEVSVELFEESTGGEHKV
jgi:hypothetical protein